MSVNIHQVSRSRDRCTVGVPIKFPPRIIIIISSFLIRINNTLIYFHILIDYFNII